MVYLYLLLLFVQGATKYKKKNEKEDVPISG